MFISFEVSNQYIAYAAISSPYESLFTLYRAIGLYCCQIMVLKHDRKALNEVENSNDTNTDNNSDGDDDNNRNN